MKGLVNFFVSRFNDCHCQPKSWWWWFLQVWRFYCRMESSIERTLSLRAV